MTSSTRTQTKPAPIDIPSKPQRIKLTQDIDFFCIIQTYRKCV
ncbi:anthranilate synthase, aminase component [Psychrobacter sp. JCM 18901]|nr:anthranilate synthase, aminase component [Psychrobacter sp. JCM 18901]